MWSHWGLGCGQNVPGRAYKDRVCVTWKRDVGQCWQYINPVALIQRPKEEKKMNVCYGTSTHNAYKPRPCICVGALYFTAHKYYVQYSVYMYIIKSSNARLLLN